MKKGKSRISSKIFLILISFFLVLLLIFLYFQLNIHIVLKKDVQNFMIVDGCSLIAGNILHEVKTDSDCKNRCSNLCGVRDLDFYNYTFITENRTCYLCDCSCK